MNIFNDLYYDIRIIEMNKMMCHAWIYFLLYIWDKGFYNNDNNRIWIMLNTRMKCSMYLDVLIIPYYFELAADTSCFTHLLKPVHPSWRLYDFKPRLTLSFIMATNSL